MPWPTTAISENQTSCLCMFMICLSSLLWLNWSLDITILYQLNTVHGSVGISRCAAQNRFILMFTRRSDPASLVADSLHNQYKTKRVSHLWKYLLSANVLVVCVCVCDCAVAMFVVWFWKQIHYCHFSCCLTWQNGSVALHFKWAEHVLLFHMMLHSFCCTQTGQSYGLQHVWVGHVWPQWLFTWDLFRLEILVLFHLNTFSLLFKQTSYYSKVWF